MAEENEQGEEAAKGGGMMKKVILGVVALALAGGGAFVGMTFLGSEESTEGEAMPDEAVVSNAPPIYTSLHPPMVVNFRDEAGDSHFMQITLEVMSRDQDAITAVRDNVAVVRNALILLFSTAVYEEVTTPEGKKQLLADGLAEVQRVMQDEIGQSGVEALYFTALVIQ